MQRPDVAMALNRLDAGEAPLQRGADVASRLANRVQLTSDGHKAYLKAVEDAFGRMSITPCW